MLMKIYFRLIKALKNVYIYIYIYDIGYDYYTNQTKKNDNHV